MAMYQSPSPDSAEYKSVTHPSHPVTEATTGVTEATTVPGVTEPGVTGRRAALSPGAWPNLSHLARRRRPLQQRFRWGDPEGKLKALPAHGAGPGPADMVAR